MSASFAYRQPSPWGFSPYHDSDPILDFLEDDAWRGTGTFAIAVLVHLLLFAMLSGSFVMPDLKPDDPELIPVQVVTFEAPQPDPEPVSEPAPAPRPAPVMPAPVQAPRPKPTPPPPQPDPEPRPVPPPSIPEPEPEPEQDLIPEPTPPPPEVLAAPVVEPEPEALPEPEPAETVVPEPLSQPDIVEPDLVPDTMIEPEPLLEPQTEVVPDPVPEPPLESLPEPILEFEPLDEPPVEPEPIIDPVPDPIPEPIQEPEIELLPELPPLDAPDPVETEVPEPGIISPEPLPDLAPAEDLAPLVQPDLIEPEPFVPDVADPAPSDPEPTETLPEPEPLELEVLTTPPSILASPEAPDSIIEERRAVPTEQSDPFLDLLARDRPLGPANPANPGQVRPPSGGSLGGPTTGGGNLGDIGNPPGGGTRRAAPGTAGWTLAPGSYGNSPGAGYEGLNLDMRCREEGRTHEDCPEYVRTFQGRDAAGFEDFELYKPQGTDRGPQAVTIDTARGIASSRGMAGFGSNSVDPWGPSTSLLDDGPEVDFSREFLSNPVRIENDPGRVRDLFTDREEPEDPFEGLVLPDQDEAGDETTIWPDD